MTPSDLDARSVRPQSEILFTEHYYANDAERFKHWQDDTQNYDLKLQEIAAANADQSFKEELNHVDQWFRYLSEAEKTTTVYTLLKHATLPQARFFIAVLRKLVESETGYSGASFLDQSVPASNGMLPYLAHLDGDGAQRLSRHTIRRPQSTIYEAGRRGPSGMERHSFALGDTDDYSRLFGPIGAGASGAHYKTAVDEFGRGRILRSSQQQAAGIPVSSPGGQSPLYNRNRPRSVIEGDSSLLSNSRWLNLPSQASSNAGAFGRLGGLSADRPKSADISQWSLGPSPENVDERTANNSVNASSSGLLARGWGVPATMQFGDLGMRHPDDDNTWDKRRSTLNRNSVHRDTSHTQAEETSTLKAPSATETANIVMTTYGDGNTRQMRAPVPSTSVSVPYTRRNLAPPGIERHYGQYLNPSDQIVPDDHDYLSDHSEVSHVSGDQRRNSAKTTSGNNNANRTLRDKKGPDVVDMELLEDVPAWFRSLRLHKYNAIFEPSKWQDIIKFSDEELEAKGVLALGARRKMLKVFEAVRAHCDAQGIPY